MLPPLRVFIYEYLCATEASAHNPLHCEGWAMLAAILQDFARLPDVQPTTILAATNVTVPPGVVVYHPDRSDEEAVFREHVRASSCSLVIAPESDDLLESRCRWVEEEGGRLLGPDSRVVRLTGDKLALGEHLVSAGVLTPPSVPLAQASGFGSFPAICKPRHGAGSQDTFLLLDSDALARVQVNDCLGELLVQPFLPGQPASVAFLVGPRQRLVLVPATQELSDDGRFHYRGGVMPLRADLAERARRLALRAVEAVPGLCGYVGVDLVLGTAADGSADWVIEINPRLTTSYVGLRVLAQDNLANLLLRVVRGERVPEPAWHAGSVRFEADGRVVREEDPCPPDGITTSSCGDPSVYRDPPG